MHLQYITDEKGRKTAVVIPISDWDKLKERYHFEEEPAKEQILQELKADYMALKKGKLETHPISELMDELKKEGYL